MGFVPSIREPNCGTKMKFNFTALSPIEINRVKGSKSRGFGLKLDSNSGQRSPNNTDETAN